MDMSFQLAICQSCTALCYSEIIMCTIIYLGSGQNPSLEFKNNLSDHCSLATFYLGSING